MVLNPHRIELTFLKIGFRSPGVVFIPVITSNSLNSIKEERIFKKIQIYACTERFNTIYKSCVEVKSTATLIFNNNYSS